MRNVRRRLAATALCVAVLACDSSTDVPQPGRLEPASAVQLSAQVGQPVPDVPAVRVLSSSGRPVPGATVTFTLGPDGGVIDGATGLTGPDGVATLRSWVLGTKAGVHTVSASVRGLDGQGVTFSATASAGPPAGLLLVAPGPAFAVRGSPLSPPPVVQLSDAWGNAAAVADVLITAASTSGGRLIDAQVPTDAAGRAVFGGLAIDGDDGEYSLSFATTGMPAIARPEPIFLFTQAPGACGPPRSLSLAPGQTLRAGLAGADGLGCIRLDAAAIAGQQFLLLLENMPATGGYGSAVFPGSATDSTFTYALNSIPLGGAQPGMLPQVVASMRLDAPERAVHAWDFGAGPIYEIEPRVPRDMRGPRLRTDRGTIDLANVAAAPAIGDTVEVLMEAIDRLGIPQGYQKAVIRHVSDLLVIAEDVRLGTTLRRAGGGFNTPLHPDTMAAIAQQYAQYARIQGDMLFDGRHNAAVENGDGRVLAVHSIMPSDNIWGYTYSSFNYFVWDYWVGTDGAAAGLNQRVQRNVDNLFMHEVAHMRHVGLLQRQGVPLSQRGNRWLVEGFARFSERLPVAMRILQQQDPSRTGNIVLPMNPDFGGLYFRDDVPTFLNASTSMFGGYQHSSYVFDYIADQVALQGGDWRAALRDVVIAAGARTTLDAAVTRWTGVPTFGELFTRARLALYLDDLGLPGLPAWTQYHQFQLRASRPAGQLSGSDPRNAWPVLVPGTSQQAAGSLAPGAAWGFLVDGTAATGSTVISITGPSTPNAVISITRIR